MEEQRGAASVSPAERPADGRTAAARAGSFPRAAGGTDPQASRLRPALPPVPPAPPPQWGRYLPHCNIFLLLSSVNDASALRACLRRPSELAERGA